MDIYEKIDEVDIVSFDIFDTLIKRNIDKPEDVFKIVESKYNYKKSNNIKDFARYRIEAEKLARSRCKSEEVTLEEIYNILKEIYPNYDSCIKNIEIEIEKDICVTNEEVYKIYQYALEKNKVIYIISDFYLDKNTLKQILNKNKINTFEEIIVSCEVGLTKKSGNLFKHIIKKYKIIPNKMMHIGDHPISDNKNPQKFEIQTYKIYNKHHQLTYKIKKKLENKSIDITENIVNSFIENNLQFKEDKQDIFFKFGYEKLGILYYGLLQKINNLAKELNVEKIYFFARDGYIIKQAYDKTFGNDKIIKTSYFYISRRAIVVPSLVENYEFDELIDVLGLRGKDTIESFLKRIGLDIKNFQNELSECNLRKDYAFEKNENVRKLFKLIRGSIVENAENELETLNKYFMQQGMNKINKCLIVDIGWRGSMQYSLEKIFKKIECNLQVHGVYLGLNKKSEIFLKSGMNATGYVFSKENQYVSEVDLTAGVGLVESLFLAPHGSVIGYKEENAYIEPVVADYEYSDDDKRIISKIQQSAIEFVEDFYMLNKNINLNVTAEIAFERLKKFIKQPDKKYLNRLGDLGFSDYTDGKLAKPKSTIKYIINPKDFKKDFVTSQWKVGFMKRIIKINFPYYRIYKILRMKFSE